MLGKFDESEGDSAGGEWSQANPSQHWLLRAQADLTPAIIAKAIGKRLKKLGVDADTAARIDSRIAIIEATERSLQSLKVEGSKAAPDGASSIRPRPSLAWAASLPAPRDGGPLCGARGSPKASWRR